MNCYAWLRGPALGTTAAIAGLLASPVLAATGGEGGGGLPQLDADTYPTQIFWLVVTFVILYLIMSKVALPRIAEVLEERQERIADDIETAERLRAEVAPTGRIDPALLEARQAAAHGLAWLATYADALREMVLLAARCELAAALLRTRAVREVVSVFDDLCERRLRRNGVPHGWAVGVVPAAHTRLPLSPLAVAR